MNRRILVVSVLLTAFVFCASALGAAPLGPPTAGLKQGQFGTAFEYAYSDADLEVSSGTFDIWFEGVKSNTFLARPRYGLADDWEIYALIGAADLEMEGIDCSSRFAYGFGTKMTFSQDANVSYGVLFEIGWRKAKGSGNLDLSDVNLSEADYDVDVEYHEITIAVGPTWQAAEGIKVYGGPFFYVLEGDLDVEAAGVSETLNIKQNPVIGGYVGVELDLCPNSSWYGEFQFTDNMWVFGTGVGWKF